MSDKIFSHPLDEQAYFGNDLGAVYSEKATVFKVWAPSASSVELRLYETGDSKNCRFSYSMTKADKGIWTITLDGDMKNTYYTYVVTVDGVSRETADIYGKAAGVNGKKSMVVDLAGTDPDGWQNDKHILYNAPTDAVVWEIHIRDFSISAMSGVSPEHRGKYLAFTESGTTLDGKGKISTCVDYLKKLGVTHVQILPMYDYAMVDESQPDKPQFNWGYDPLNYNVPEGSYSTDASDGNVRIKELKQMVMALHNAGIGVIMDVVYNHVFAAKGSWFDNTVPNYYFRFDKHGKLSDGSACGNETASDHLMYRKFMTDSILYWIKEYHIDGFRFDLMGVHDVETMNAIRKAIDENIEDGRKIIMYGEPWTGGPLGTNADTCIKDNIHKLDSRVGAFNDCFRDAVKGHVFNAHEQGFVQSGDGVQKVKDSITANCISGRKWFNQPSQAIAYTSAHDNFTLYDKLVLSVKNDGSYAERDERLVAMNKLAAVLTLTSQGIVFMQAGEEFARTKFGDENSYVSSDKINQLDWSSLEKYGDLADYYKGLIAIRKHFAPFREPTKKSAELIKFSSEPWGIVAYTLENTITPETEWKSIAVIVNAAKAAKTVTLNSDNDKWTVIANGDKAGLEMLGTVSGKNVTVPPISAMILVQE